MALSEQRKEYLYEYQKTKLKRIPLDVTKEKYEQIAAFAAAKNEKVNGYIKKAIDERMERDGALPAAEKQSTREPDSQAATPSNMGQEKHYKPFTEKDEQRINFPELLSNIRYQMDISDIYGMDVLTTLLEKARQQATVE